MSFVFGASAAELSVNGSFEDPQPGGSYEHHPGGSNAIAGWLTILTGVEKFEPAVVFMGNSARNGAFVLDLNTDFGVGGGIEQTIATNPGQTYELFFSIGSFFSRGRSGIANINVVINGMPHLQTFATLSDTIQWDDRSIVFVATSTSTTISFQNYDLPDTTFSFLDAVSLIGMPFINPDGDDDGVPDEDDECPTSNIARTLLIGGCDTRVPNAVGTAGCTIADQLSMCDSARTPVQYVACVAYVTLHMKKVKLINLPQALSIAVCTLKSVKVKFPSHYNHDHDGNGNCRR